MGSKELAGFEIISPRRVLLAPDGDKQPSTAIADGKQPYHQERPFMLCQHVKPPFLMVAPLNFRQESPIIILPTDYLEAYTKRPPTKGGLEPPFSFP